MQNLSTVYVVSSGIHYTEQLYLHCRRSRDNGWTRVHTVPCGNVQTAHRNWHVHELRDGEVLGFCWCYSRGRSVFGLYGLLQLACGESSFDELHLQRRCNRVERRPVHTVRGGKVQNVNRHGHVLGLSSKLLLCGRRRYRKFDVHRLSTRQLVANWKCHKYSVRV